MGLIILYIITTIENKIFITIKFLISELTHWLLAYSKYQMVESTA